MPLIVKAFMPEGSLKKAARRAREIQFERAETARLMAKEAEDDLTKKENRNLRILHQLFRERRVRGESP